MTSGLVDFAAQLRKGEAAVSEINYQALREVAERAIQQWNVC